MLKAREFQPARTVRPLEPGVIHLWSVDLALPDGQVSALRRLLTGEERARADRFRFDRHRRRFTVRRARLRQLVGGYRGLPPEAVRFSEGERGKPFLAPELDDPSRPLQFNLTDSGDLAVVGFAHDLELGVDIEILRDMPDALDLSERFFAEDERQVLRDVPEAVRSEAFFYCWTRKEAYIKAIGEGLAEPLDRFCVTLYPPEPARFLHVGGDAREAGAWTLSAFEPAPGAVGAIAYRAGEQRLEGWRWTGG